MVDNSCAINISVEYRYVKVQASNISGDISLFNLIGTINTNSVVLRKKCIWDTLDIDWSQIKY